MNRFAMGTLAFAALGILATGCKASFSGDGHNGSVTVNDPGSSSGAKNPGGNPTGQPAGGTNAATPRCHTSGLHAGFEGSDAGAGQRYIRLVLANTSGHACRMYGWPGLGLGTGTASISTNAVRTGTPTSFVVLPGGHAHAKLHWTVVPSADEPQGSACEPTPAWIYVTPPNETTQLQVPWSYGAVCGHGRIDLSPLAPGPGA